MKELINVSVNDKKFHDIITTAYPKPENTIVKKGETLKGGAWLPRHVGKISWTRSRTFGQARPRQRKMLGRLSNALMTERPMRVLSCRHGFARLTSKRTVRKVTREVVGLTNLEGGECRLK